MSQENVEMVRAMYEQFARGDFSSWADLPDDSSSLPAPNCLTRVPIVERRQLGG